jgi:hypothetical protein
LPGSPPQATLFYQESLRNLAGRKSTFDLTLPALQTDEKVLASVCFNPGSPEYANIYNHLEEELKDIRRIQLGNGLIFKPLQSKPRFTIVSRISYEAELDQIYELALKAYERHRSMTVKAIGIALRVTPPFLRESTASLLAPRFQTGQSFHSVEASDPTL